MDQLFHPRGWDFHLKAVVTFGTAVRLRGFLGVGPFIYPAAGNPFAIAI